MHGLVQPQPRKRVDPPARFTYSSQGICILHDKYVTYFHVLSRTVIYCLTMCCYVMLCCVMLCHVMFCKLLCHAMLCHVRLFSLPLSQFYFVSFVFYIKIPYKPIQASSSLFNTVQPSSLPFNTVQSHLIFLLSPIPVRSWID